MRLTPAQIAVHQICGPQLPLDDDLSLIQRIRSGHDLLVRISGRDFGYDLQAWHDYVSASRDGGYNWNSSIKTPKIMAAALVNPEWLAAVDTIVKKPTNQKNTPELPIGPFVKSKSLGGNRVIFIVRWHK